MQGISVLSSKLIKMEGRDLIVKVIESDLIFFYKDNLAAEKSLL